ncbi:Gfo/Idh/MocA family protein [Neobacillus cucumis]|uniref:Gfo/Idh/MocA family oxidoreductase n=1 Tax=Neobacillus cucumis TaxID=1740721 RepID=A0A2N5HDY0_9BACI|nr:Gfo/Idh/MocA family oxidoreductase [Neobacillus cucumis]PLS03739.1 gfo/Idh/MocA family oxidoreductase [Neobacillus cucumis]
MERKIKWGILSTAQIAVEKLIPAIQRSTNGQVYAIASSSGKAKLAAEKFQIPVFYESYDELLADPAIDAVYIPLPNNMHYEWTIKAAKAKKHILCEKPAALEAEQVAEMISVCKQNGVMFMEGFMYRFHPQHQKVKDLIKDKAIGDVKLMRAFFSFFMEEREGNIRLNADLGGGALFDIGCYCVNSLRYIVEEEPLSLKILSETNQDGVDTSAAGVLLFPNHVLATFACSFDADSKDEYEIVGTNGTIRVPYAYRPDLQSGRGVVQLVKDGELTEFMIEGDQYRLEVEHFADCILSNQEPIYSGENSYNNLKVIQTLYQLLEANKENNA